MLAAVSLRNLSVEIDNQPILRNLSAELSAGQIIGLLGPSGSGKTTLMRILVGLKQPTSGSATVLGLAAGQPKLRRQIGYMTQSPAVYSDLTVAENLRYFAAIAGAKRDQVSAVVEKVGLSAEHNRIVKTLSGGQRSRVSLAIALLGSPELLILDEPTVGLDPVLRRDLWQLFAELAAQGTTLLVSSHVMDEAEHCDSIMLIRNGSLIDLDTPREMKQKTKSQSMDEAFLRLVEAGS